MLQDAADVVQGGLREAAVQVAHKEILTALGERLVHVHAATVVAEERLRHERGRLAVAVCDVLDDVLQHHDVVGFLHERAELHADFALAGCCDFMVVYLDDEAHFLERQTHGGPNVLQGVDGRDRKISALDARAVAEIALVELLAALPRAFVRVDRVRSALHLRRPTDVVENEEFVLGAEECLIGNAGRFQIGLGALRRRTRVTLVALHRGRLDDVAANVQGGFFHERIDDRRARIRHQDHVGLVDALPTGDRRAVEHLAVFENAGIELVLRHRYVLLFAARVGEPEVDELDAFFLDELQNIGGRHWFDSSVFICRD